MPDIFAPEELPIGSIVEWSGLLSNIPQGWQLCDGTNGTPDLLDQFVRGAPAGCGPGGTGGSSTVTLTTSQIPSHNHSVTDPQHHHTIGGANFSWVINGCRNHFSCPALCTASTGITTGNSGSGGCHENKPAYYEVAFIYRLS